MDISISLASLAMNYSLGELESRARYATRGAGYHWGHADEAAAAVRWLESVDLPGAAVLAARLKRMEQQTADPAATGPKAYARAQCCPIASSSRLLDTAHSLEKTIHLQQIEDPLLLVPAFWQLAQTTQTCVSLSWSCAEQSARLWFDRAGAGTCAAAPGALLATVGNQVTAQFDDSAKSEPGKALLKRARAHIALADWDCLETFAARTRAPATEESRRLGAGAGTQD